MDVSISTCGYTTKTRHWRIYDDVHLAVPGNIQSVCLDWRHTGRYPNHIQCTSTYEDEFNSTISSFMRFFFFLFTHSSYLCRREKNKNHCVPGSRVNPASRGLILKTRTGFLFRVNESMWQFLSVLPTNTQRGLKYSRCREVLPPDCRGPVSASPAPGRTDSSGCSHHTQP